MFKRFMYFIKYNNATILIIAVIFVFGATAFASEPGRAAIGQKQTDIVGVDNSLLLEADLDNFDMEFRIEKIEEDEKMYYITYVFMDLAEINKAWQYQLKEKIRRVSKKLKQDLDAYLIEEFKEEYQSRLKELKQAKSQAEPGGPQIRTEVVAYSGLVGKTLDIASKVFPGYEPIKKNVLKTPVDLSKLREERGEQSNNTVSLVDNFEQIYNDYINVNDPDLDNVFGAADNCPNIYNTFQLDSDGDGIGDICDTDNKPVGENSLDSAIAEDPLADEVFATESTSAVDRPKNIFDDEILAVEIIDLELIDETPVETPNPEPVVDESGGEILLPETETVLNEEPTQDIVEAELEPESVSETEPTPAPEQPAETPSSE